MGNGVVRAQVPPDPGPAYAPGRFALDDLPPYVPEHTVSGTIRLWGSGYIAAGQLLRTWEAGFRKIHPAVAFASKLGDSLTAVPALYSGAADIGVGPRISWNDLKAFNHTRGYDPLAIMAMSGSYNVPGWNAAYAILVYRDNPIDRLTMGQLDGIFGASRDGGWSGIVWRPELARGPEGNLRTWGQLGLTGAWANRPIHVYGANLRYGVSLSLSNTLLAGSDRWNESIRLFTNRKLERPTPTAPDGTQLALEQIVAAIRDDPAGIGFSSIAFQTPQTKVLEIAPRPGSPYVALTLENVRNRTYPLADESYLFVDRPPDRPLEPKVREFLRFVLSREGQQAVALDGKYLPLTAAMVREELNRIER